MFRSALGVFISLVALSVAAPAASAQSSTAKTAKTAKTGKKQVVKKAAVKSKKATALKASHPIVKTSIRGAVAHKRPHKSGYQRVSFAPPIPSTPPAPPVLTAGDIAGLNLTRDAVGLKSSAAVVIDQVTSQVLFEKNAKVALPIASLTKLMTAVVVVEARQNMDEILEVTSDDVDREKNSSSRLRVGAHMTRANMLHIALMSSENRAASALGRHYPGGLTAFVAAMNAKAKALGMADTHFVDSTGLSSQNIASARDLSRLVVAAYQHPIIREYSTDARYAVATGTGHQLQYMNSNRLVMNPDWEIGLQKTGYISEAGRCLVMQTRIDGRPVVMVFLDSKGKDSRLADAGRIRKWLANMRPETVVQASANQS
ncbi:D-alanyl-D-alanine endopeptidase [Noviherbaspirillum sp. Root189]|uniref:D-alanyl-D-alanine endopeptidase n=1 Tax=Noviherbaspirillum sp. Root189 TaxID=1736487 RepID=UPI00070F6304|nr:D-alanyl-D-alanine endopeptidase [Noviherbaspirillum sp. Root189]KRB93033.1 D-alanyl-D-alanine carboxypeptidase [Noviherbaspirillum sp. Root189]